MFGFVSPAEACSCAVPTDIVSWVDQSEAVFVGTLVDKRTAEGSEFGMEAIYVFEVETWVKGDLGEVVEVRSADNGAACGFEFWGEDMRIGAALRQIDGELHGNLCDQIDAEALLAAMKGPVISSTGLGHLVVAYGWASPKLAVIDREGGLVTELTPSTEVPEFVGTSHLDICPESRFMVQTLDLQMVVWDLSDMTVAATIDLAGDNLGWVSDVSCRDPEATTIWMVVSTELGSDLVEVVPTSDTLAQLPGSNGRIGDGFVIVTEDGLGSAVWFDVETGDSIVLAETAPDRIQAVYAEPHPTRDQAALLISDFDAAGPVGSTLSVVGPDGEVIQSVSVPIETYSPVWIDDRQVVVTGFDYEGDEQGFAFILDVETGTLKTIESWTGQFVVTDGATLYGATGGEIVAADLDTTVVTSLASLPTVSAGPLVVLTEAPRVDPPPPAQPETPEPTTPPITIPEAGPEQTGNGFDARVVAIPVMVGFGALLIWMAVRRPPDHTHL